MLYLIQDARRDSDSDDIFIGEYKQTVKHIKGKLSAFRYEDDSEDDGCSGFIEHYYVIPLNGNNINKTFRNMKSGINNKVDLEIFLKSELAVKSAKSPKKTKAKRMSVKRTSAKRNKTSAKRVKRSTKKRVTKKRI